MAPAVTITSRSAVTSSYPVRSGRWNRTPVARSESSIRISLIQLSVSTVRLGRVPRMGCR